MESLLVRLESSRISQGVMETQFPELWNWMMKERRDLFSRVDKLRHKYQSERLPNEEPLSNFLKFESRNVTLENLEKYYEMHKALSAHNPKLYVIVEGKKKYFDSIESLNHFLAILNPN